MCAGDLLTWLGDRFLDIWMLVNLEDADHVSRLGAERLALRFCVCACALRQTANSGYQRSVAVCLCSM